MRLHSSLLGRLVATPVTRGGGVLGFSVLVLAVLVGALLAACSEPTPPDGEEPGQRKAGEAAAVEAVRSWREPVKRHTRPGRRRVQLTVDYGDGSVSEHSPASRRRGEDRPARRPPGPSAAEIEAALTAAAANPAVRALLSEHGASLAGGYPIADDGLAAQGARPDRGCGAGARCYAFLAFVPGVPRPVGDVVVDLVSGQVAVAELEPER